MVNQKFTSPLFWAAIIGAVKIVLDTVGIQVIDNQKMDSLANGIAAAVAIAGVFVDHGAKVEPVTAQGILDAVSKLVTDLQPIITAPTIATAPPEVTPANIPIPTTPPTPQHPTATVPGETFPPTT